MNRQRDWIRKDVMTFWIRSAYLHTIQRDMTVILVSHSMEDIARYADRHYRYE